MKTGEASRTAEYMALFRALEETRPRSRRLFSDPQARGFLRPSLRLAADASRLPGVGELVRGIIDRRWPGGRTSAAARTAFIDERLSRAVAGGIRQVVILGAGFDSRAWRMPGCRECRVFEVDHPDTQERKRRLLRSEDVGAADYRAAHYGAAPAAAMRGYEFYRIALAEVPARNETR